MAATVTDDAIALSPTGAPGPSYSVLFGPSRPDDVDSTPEPAYFRDLGLDQVVAALTGNPDQFRLEPLFRATLADRHILMLRHEVFADLESPNVRQILEQFVHEIATVHDRVRASKSLRVEAQRDRWHLNAASTYCRAVRSLADGLAHAPGVWATALSEVGRRLERLIEAPEFTALEQRASRLQEQLDSLQYGVYLSGTKITVAPYRGEADYSEHLVGLFDRFRQERHWSDAEREDRERKRRRRDIGSDPIRERIISLVADLYPAPFEELAAFRRDHAVFLDPTVSLFYREIQFYLRYRELLDRLSGVGLPSALPELRDEPGVDGDGVYDIALALRRLGRSETRAARNADGRLVPVVGNDLAFGAGERRVVITGPNQGGKTTLSRAIGQLHHLAAIGCPVPATRVSVAPPDQIFTHFEREELGHRTGKLEDDLERIRAILDRASASSLVVLNEIFASTTTADAVELARAVLGRLDGSGALVVCVTFLDEICHLPGTVTLVAQVDPADVTRRTFQVVRAPADGRAYATALAAKHRLTYDDLTRRLTGQPTERQEVSS